MGAFLGRLLRFVLAVVLAPLVAAFTVTAFEYLTQNAQDWLQSSFTIGFVASLPIWILLVGTGNSFTQFLEHELGHAIMAKLLFRRVVRLEVTPYEESRKGLVGFSSNGGCLDFLIYLAPYYLPLFTLPFLVVQPFVGQSLQSILNLIIGVTYAFHFTCLVGEFGLHQSDIRKMGCFFSSAITLLFNAVILVFVISVIIDDIPTITNYFSQAFQLTQEYYQVAFETLQDLRARL